MMHQPGSVSVFLRHAVELPAQLLQKRLELVERVVPQSVHQCPVRQDNIRLELL